MGSKHPVSQRAQAWVMRVRGDGFATFFANACASAAKELPLEFVTCFEAGTGNPGNGEGDFLDAINSLPLPLLQSTSSTLPQYDVIIGQRMSCNILTGGCSLES